jgi:hypothetical protein
MHCTAFEPRWEATFQKVGEAELGHSDRVKAVEVVEQPAMFDRLNLDETEKAKFVHMGYPTLYRAVRGGGGDKTRLEFFEGYTPPAPTDGTTDESAQAERVREWLRSPPAPPAPPAHALEVM